ncbi:hypothetical protein KIN20_003973 [Parelaphostrongylus tenuis]|uniref:Uncharacterized protein n=1 Tax=Parelaphostrongylus tenuis TaxID=148309 RepID=A0AAD5M117_PARTN|nr:hypothetical protein KIN20_003973 [Parelaphostrongylus tenuis]
MAKDQRKQRTQLFVVVIPSTRKDDKEYRLMAQDSDNPTKADSDRSGRRLLNLILVHPGIVTLVSHIKLEIHQRRTCLISMRLRRFIRRG